MNSDQSNPPNEDQTADDATETRAGHLSNTASSEEFEVVSDLEIAVGRNLGKYELRKLLGQGAMGAVFLAYDPFIQREVAIKVLQPSLSEDTTALNRFLVEARAVGQLNHPNAIAIYDIAAQDERYFIVMELAPGGNIRDILRTKRFSYKEACRIGLEAARGLEAAHQAGMIHRDVKPDNLMLSAEGTIKLVDFGLSKFIDREKETSVTRTGEMLGTPLYMSPEQIKSEEVDARSDIYSWGATFFHLLTGDAPFPRATVAQVVFAHLYAPRPDPRAANSEVSPRCAAIVAKAMSVDPKDRYESISEVIADLESVIDKAGHPTEVSLHTSETMMGSADELDTPVRVPRVLVVEPAKLGAKIIADVFHRAGCEVVTHADSPTSALQHMKSQGADVVITTRQLQKTTGELLIREIRESPASAETMCVLISSDSPQQVRAESMIQGTSAFVKKQAHPAEILKAIYVCTDFVFPDFGMFRTDFSTLNLAAVKSDGNLAEPIHEALQDLGAGTRITTLTQVAEAESLREYDLVMWLDQDADAMTAFETASGKLLAGHLGDKTTMALIDQDLVLQRYKRPAVVASCNLPLDKSRIARLLGCC